MEPEFYIGKRVTSTTAPFARPEIHIGTVIGVASGYGYPTLLIKFDNCLLGHNGMSTPLRSGIPPKDINCSSYWFVDQKYVTIINEPNFDEYEIL